jgi:conjugal transfer pilus assembly protein TraW
MVRGFPRGLARGLIWLSLWPFACVGVDLGVQGHLFPIQEPDLLETIETRLKVLGETGELAKREAVLKERLKKRLQTPTPVAGMARTRHPRSYTWDPTLTVGFDLKDAGGRVFHKAGTRFNPLKVRPYSKTLLLIAGDDPDQVAWVKARLTPLTHLILTSGNPFKLSEQLGVTCFFDQGGILTKKLGIRQVPALVRQEGLVLRVEEVWLPRGYPQGEFRGEPRGKPSGESQVEPKVNRRGEG